ncbi:uncharacterized protein [Argopecten irradians]|uniref:uncharacterized protein n=1 Tax=Argopecten irradians TaxID=31199 RepID=UPI003713E3EC
MRPSVMNKCVIEPEYFRFHMMAGATSNIPTKKRRLGDNDSLFTDFPQATKRQLAIKLHDLCDTHGPVWESLKFNNSNAADENGGIPFCKAYCSVTASKKKLFFGAIFVDGLIMMSNFLEQGIIPSNKPKRLVLGNLLDYIVDFETQAALLELESFGEAELAIVLVNHLLGKLASSTKYIINKHRSGKKLENCPCSHDCDMSGTYGDTSIGNELVWHGHLDIIINQDIGVSIVEREDTNEQSHEEKNPVEVSTSLERNQQIIAQCVVFSFLQRQNRPLSNHFLFPYIGVKGSNLIIYIYDSEHDVLLQSSTIPVLVSNGRNSRPKVNLTAILVSWLAVNCQHLSDGLPETLKSKDKVAEFLLQVKDRIDIYEELLKSGDVGGSIHLGLFSKSEESYEVCPCGLDEARRKLYEVVWRRTEEG